MRASSQLDSTLGNELVVEMRRCLRHRIQVPVFPWPARPTRMLRISCHAHNERSDYLRLEQALREELGRAP